MEVETLKPKTPRMAGSAATLTVDWWPIDRPKQYVKNARKWGKSAVEKVAASIKSFGWVQPIVCDREDVIVIGHLRRESAYLLGLAEVPVHVASNLSPAQIKALRIADNRTHEEADWIEDLLAAELLDLKSLDFDLGLTLTGACFESLPNHLDVSRRKGKRDLHHSDEVPGIPTSFHHAAIGMPITAFENVRDFMRQHVRQQGRSH
jgi:hypothetical protein